MAKFAKDPATGRYITPCDGCGQQDTHPKHSIQMNRKISRFHFDCHAPAGCPDCVKALADHKKAQGDKLIASLAAAREVGSDG